jgi:GNAT superfamily N-acetyltransferase
MIQKYTKQLKELLSHDVIIQCYLYKEWKTLELYNLVYIKNQDSGLKFRVVNAESKIVSQFQLLQMPGCCGICISTGTYVNPEFRGKGVNVLLNNFRIDIAKDLGYGLLICTDLKSNIPQMKTLDKNGWKHIYEFKNPRTNNILNITIKEL